MKTAVGAPEPPDPQPAPFAVTYTTGACPVSGWSVLDCRCAYHRPDLHVPTTAAWPQSVPGRWPVVNTAATATVNWSGFNLNVPAATAGG